MNKKINLMIIGAEKAGTTSLLRYLDQHPDICAHKQIEMSYFVMDDVYEEGYEKVFTRFYPHCKESQIIVAKNIGIMYSNNALFRLKKHNPEIEIVIILRNPIDRAYSAYWYARRKGREALKSFEEAIDAEPKRLKENEYKWRHNAYLRRGEYGRSLDLIYKHFPKSKVHVFYLEELRDNPGKICDRLFSLINVDENIKVNLGLNKKHNNSSEARSMLLSKFLFSDNKCKKYIKNIFPNVFLQRIKRKFDKLNANTFTPTPMKINTREKLIEYYRRDTEVLLKHLDSSFYVESWYK